MYAIILAAGLASRSGGEKLFWEIGGKPLIVHAVEAALDAGMQTIVVTGNQKERVEALLAPHPQLVLTHNACYENGQMTSTQQGVRALPSSADFFIALADMPLIRASHYHLLSHALPDDAAGIRPVVGQAVGHPVLLKATLIPAILQADKSMRMKEVLAPYRIARLQSQDPAWVSDIDTIDSYRQLLARMKP